MTEPPEEISEETGPVEEQIIRRAKLSYERLPMMEVIFERYALSLATAIKTYVGAIAEATLDSFEYMPCGEALEALDNPALIAVVEPQPWDGAMALLVDPDLLFAVLEILLGGRSTARQTWSPRSFTAIEKRLGQRLFQVILEDLSRAFAQLCEVDFVAAHTETNPKSLVLAPPNTPAVLITMTISIEERSGKIKFVIPNSAFETVRPLLAQSFMGGQLGGDSGWRARMSDAIGETSVTLDAVLRERPVPLAEVLGWRLGAVIDLDITTDEEVTVLCAGRPMLRAAMGRRKNASVALRVTDKLIADEEIANAAGD
jgi:flagellar motor switch protein FliM